MWTNLPVAAYQTATLTTLTPTSFKARGAFRYRFQENRFKNMKGVLFHIWEPEPLRLLPLLFLLLIPFRLCLLSTLLSTFLLILIFRLLFSFLFLSLFFKLLIPLAARTFFVAAICYRNLSMFCTNTEATYLQTSGGFRFFAYWADNLLLLAIIF